MQSPNLVPATRRRRSASSSSSSTTPAMQLVCSTNLQLDGYHVLEAANEREGLKLALDHMPVLVLLEISMPVLDGFSLAAASRRTSARASCR